MEVRQLFDLSSCTYTYLIWDELTRDAAIIDSVKEQVQRDVKLINELKLNIQYLIETHIHADHITGAGELREIFQAKTVVSQYSQSQCADLLVDDGHNVYLGQQKIQILYTPGHTNTDICLLVDNLVFTGDTLLIRGSGRTDFQSGSSAQAYDSITKKLFTLDDQTIVYPGHDYQGFSQSSIAEEKAFNPRVGQNATRQHYMDIMDNMELPKPKMIDIAVPGNLQCGLLDG